MEGRRPSGREAGRDPFFNVLIRARPLIFLLLKVDPVIDG